MHPVLTQRDIAIRHHVYQTCVQETLPPSPAATAEAFGIGLREAEESYLRLHQNHLLFLEPNDATVRMANPFSAIPTPFRVAVGDKQYYANCAWDMLGIPAMLGVDAVLDGEYSDTGQSTRMIVEQGRVHHEEGVIHFPLPVRQWYDDLILT